MGKPQLQRPAANREGSHPPLIAAIQPHRRTSHLRTSNLAEREGLLGASCASPRAQARGCLRHPQAFLTPASNREGSHPPLIAAIQPHRRTSHLRTSNLAEREGFEPSIRLLTVYTLSRRAPSTARTPLRVYACHRMPTSRHGKRASIASAWGCVQACHAAPLRTWGRRQRLAQ